MNMYQKGDDLCAPAAIYIPARTNSVTIFFGRRYIAVQEKTVELGFCLPYDRDYMFFNRCRSRKYPELLCRKSDLYIRCHIPE